MTSTTVCRQCRVSTVATKKVHLFSVIGIEHKWSSTASILDIIVEDDDRISPYMSIKCRNRLTTLEDAINDLNAFRKLVPDMDFSTVDMFPCNTCPSLSDVQFPLR